MIPKNRPNMIAWVAAQNDPGVRGKTTVFRFPSESSIFGPAQVEAQIDSDPIISAQTTLWNQSGSTVIRGNLIVVPVGGSLIYLQPVDPIRQRRRIHLPLLVRLQIGPVLVGFAQQMNRRLDPPPRRIRHLQPQLTMIPLFGNSKRSKAKQKSAQFQQLRLANT